MVYKAHLVRKKGLEEISISESVAVKILKGDITLKKDTKGIQNGYRRW